MCFRKLRTNESLSGICIKAIPVLNDAKAGFLSREALNVIKPLECISCKNRFPDMDKLSKHRSEDHGTEIMIPKNLTTAELKYELQQRNAMSNGSRNALIKILESLL